jgi:hypothetical protein
LFPKREKQNKVIQDELEQANNQPQKEYTCESFFDEQLDYALQIGMTPSQFWYDNPRLILNYQEKFKAEQMRQQQMIWLQGAYVKNALQSTILVAGLADKNTAQKMPKYPEMPKFEEQRELSEEQKHYERLRLANYLKSFNKK